jgi:dipeptidyl aminopeptidase/acylaminoacyl peptidase
MRTQRRRPPDDPTSIRIPFLCLILVFVPLFSSSAETWNGRVERYELFTEFASLFEGGSVTPHWLPGGRAFWYATRAGSGFTFVRVDARNGRRTAFFDEARLLEGLNAATGSEATVLPFRTFELDDDGTRVRFAVGDDEWSLDLRTYELARVTPGERANDGDVASPDGRFVLGAAENNIWMRAAGSDETVRLTRDGEDDYPWSLDELLWSSDGRFVALPRYDTRAVHKMPVVKWLPDQETVEWGPYAFAREPDARVSLHIIDLEGARVTTVDAAEEGGEYQFLVGWRSGDAELLFLRFGPGMRSLSLMAADPESGRTRTIVRDERETFIEGLHITVSAATFHYPLPDNRHFIWKSERDGWLHFYLYRYDGTLVRRLTRGEFEVNEVTGFDEKRNRVYFTAQADPRNPYDRHLYRVSLDGSGMTQLTEAVGTHRVALCPDLRCFVDAHSSPSRPPMTDLRSIDGSLITTLERADVSRLEGMDWKPPEEFVVKAADGKSDLYGLLFKPHDFDSEKRYPVIEVIYAGSWSPVVPRSFGAGENATLAHALAQLNFVTFVVDNRGTPGRGKAFQDVIYGQIGRHEIPDHVATLRQLAADRPYMDLDRVGVHGKSWGGYFALRAMLQAPDSYHVGIASGIVADLSTTAAFPVAPYMGLPGENADGYEYANCLTMADRLKGKLLLTIATADLNTPFAQTMRIVEALIKARKPIDLMLFPDQHHWLQGESMTYFYDVLRRYFVEHLKPEGSVAQQPAAP